MMRKFLLLGASIAIATGMSGCVTTPQLTALPANDAVTHSLAELYQQPSYRVHSTMHLTELNFPDSPNGTAAANSTSTADTKLLDRKEFSKWFEIFSARNEFAFDGVIDLKHQQFEVTPSMTYKAVNAGAYIRIPMMFDLANSQGYVDLSALSPFLVNTDSDGKYSQFSIEPITKRIDFKKLYRWSEDISLDSSRQFDPRMFHDLPLNSADLAQGGVRKIEFSASYEELMNINRAMFDIHRAEFLAAIKKKPETTNGESTSAKASSDAAIDGFIDIISAMGTNYGLPSGAPSPFKINGTLHKVYLLDRAGRLLQSSSDAVFDVDAKSMHNFKMGFNTLTNYSEYGSARINFVPSASNTVLLSESTKGTMVDMIKAAADKHKNAPLTGTELATPSVGKTPFTIKPNLFVGTWKLDLPNHCTETYYVTSNYNTLVTSANEVSSSFYTLSATPSDKGFYKLVDRIINNNGLKDCSGHITPHGDVSTVFLQFNEDKKTAQMCFDESGEKCHVLRRVADAAK